MKSIQAIEDEHQVAHDDAAIVLPMLDATHGVVFVSGDFQVSGGLIKKVRATLRVPRE